MQELTFILHGAGCILAVFILPRAGKWRYFIGMFLFYNLVGFLYYAGVFYVPNFLSHPFSRLRAFLQALGWLVYSISLYRSGSNDEH